MASLPSYTAPKQIEREITGQDGAPMRLVPEGESLYGDDNQRLWLPVCYLDTYEVTTKCSAAFLQVTGREQLADWIKQVTRVGGGDRPVVPVTWEVGASPSGIQDLAGNVWEWTSSDSDSLKVFRGGSWSDHSENLRSTGRTSNRPSRRRPDIGFRCARDAMKSFWWSTGG